MILYSPVDSYLENSGCDQDIVKMYLRVSEVSKERFADVVYGAEYSGAGLVPFCVNAVLIV